MRTLRWPMLWLLAAFTVGFTVQVGNADDDKGDKGYTSLFNGKDLTGWRLGKKKLDGLTQTPNKKWHVTDGAIVIDGGGGGDIYTVEDFNKDYHLKLEFRAARKADSGLYLRGRQLQVRDYPRAGPYSKAKFKDDDWNELDITVKGKTALCKCNGDVIEKAFKIGASGGIGLQSESGKFEFRKIRLRILE
ncbi:MAG: DUF1080 domain-containing protein [Planctomycetes bacterium]|nr:DUF1080 domain-containing protein [Planctomycetota bacterium]